MVIHNLAQGEEELKAPNGHVLATRFYVRVTFWDLDGCMITIQMTDETKRKSDRRFNMLKALAELDGEGMEL